ncbi:DUF2283 domain-containing protein [Roseicella aquatilis]|uniref:DUF2283 domain-containing protein n=1 Tax=Roseicella aquatilis TaxID=2527868 RepID=A0A4R4D5I5_9PROT|nr:DUF2283 domain-containing protein [Roseicella aquatilis]TCZ55233.1 DUF2283 domain-containing protein [Roseicella aquatilis]
MMRTSYDPEADAFHARFAPDPVEIEATGEVAPGVMIDFDADGDVVGIEVLSVSRRGRKAMERVAAKPAAAE